MSIERVLGVLEEAAITGRSATGKDFGVQQLVEMRACQCTCCADALERRRCGAFIAFACNCADFESAERCDCRFCVSQVGS